jgi:hypothetical protein
VPNSLALEYHRIFGEDFVLKLVGEIITVIQSGDINFRETSSIVVEVEGEEL